MQVWKKRSNGEKTTQRRTQVQIYAIVKINCKPLSLRTIRIEHDDI